MPRYGLILLLMLPQLVYAMDFRIDAGSESFNWKEYDSSDSKLLEESGLRYFVGFDADNVIDRYWESEFSGRVYSGTVDYDGQSGSGQAASTDTDYDGYQLEAGFRYFPESQNHLPHNQGRVGIRMAAGIDSWRRKLHDAKLADGTIARGYTEEYSTTYGRIAAYYGGGSYTFSVGVKYPFETSETVGLKALGYSSDITLYPQGRFSPYANIALQLNRNWGIQLYYDSYRFAESDPETVETSTGATATRLQPKIHQEVIGGKLSFLF